MLHLFKKSRRSWPRQRPSYRLPDGVRIYAIGDVHGCLSALTGLYHRIQADAADYEGTAYTVFLGDYIDRGPDSRGVLDLLTLRPPPAGKGVHLLGNHEAAFLAFLKAPAENTAWLDWGGLETVRSYAPRAAADYLSDKNVDDLAAAFVEAVPSCHLAFLRALQLTWTCGGFVFVHAGVRPGVPLEAQSDEDLLWIREDFLTSRADFGMRVVHGHTPAETPVIRPNRVGLDTGAYLTGCLTAAVIEAGEVRLLQSGSGIK